MIVGSVQWSGTSLGTSLPPGKELVAAPGASSDPRRQIRSQTFPPFLQDGNDFRNEVRVPYFYQSKNIWKEKGDQKASPLWKAVGVDLIGLVLSLQFFVLVAVAAGSVELFFPI